MRLHLEAWGSPSAPTVVLVHGYPDTHEVWRPVAEHLAEAGLHAVAYDVRGAGRSPAPAALGGYGLDHLVDDLAAVIDDVSPDRPVHLVGHDWGSMQGWHAVTTHGERLSGRVRGFTSISGPGIDQLRPSPGQALRSWYVGAFHLPGAPLAVRAALSRDRFRAMLERDGVPTDDRWPAPTIGDDAARGIGLYRANILPRLLRRGDGSTRPATVPVQVVVAARDPFIAPSSIESVVRSAPDVTRVDIDAGHWVVRSHPHDVAAAVLAATGVPQTT